MARKMLGSVDLLGLNSFGENPGLNPIFGALIGGGVAGITSIAVGHVSTGVLARNRELVGLAGGLAVAGAMYSMKSTRHAAVGAAVGAVLASGLAWLEKVILGTVQMPAKTADAATQVAAGTSGMGMAQMRQLGMSQINQLGMANIGRVPKAYGTIPGVAGLGGVAGLQAVRPGTMPANLLGASTAASRQISLMGGPNIHGISASYGATSVGGGR